MKYLSYNVNGIRAALKKGFADWMAEELPDLIALQEVKASQEQVDLRPFEDLGYQAYWHDAEKKGYSGVAFLSRLPVDQVVTGMENPKYDAEGRVLRVDIADISFYSAYFPSGTTGDLRQNFKYEFLDDFYTFIQGKLKEKEKIVVSGDYNICHKAIDIHNPVSNKKSSGFLPEERAWMDKLTENGFQDSFRLFHEGPDHYSWWSYRANARAKNLGWRIDYHMVSEALVPQVKGAGILPDVHHSDHCPVAVEIDI
ncbi:exodeoxyribonuclease III [Nitritalea halalkaliphila]|nr:exodeoxyribonuclease III [Nitritalea halalkaliphila]